VRRMGAEHPNWRGGRTVDHGYVFVKNRSHPHCNKGGYVREHILVAEEVLGRVLPDSAVVHHVNDARADNRKANLVICQDDRYHRLIHNRRRALRACGHVDWRLCCVCQTWDAPRNLVRYSQRAVAHAICKRLERNQARWRREAKLAQAKDVM
jgi:hypothetical protein